MEKNQHKDQNPELPEQSQLNETFVSDVRTIIEQGRQKAYQLVNSVMLDTYWNIGRRIVEEEQHGQQRAGYGEQIIPLLSKRLTHIYGKGFSPRYLSYFREFYLVIPAIKILQTRLQNLTWGLFLKAMRVESPAILSLTATSNSLQRNIRHTSLQKNN